MLYLNLYISVNLNLTCSFELNIFSSLSKCILGLKRHLTDAFVFKHCIYTVHSSCTYDLYTLCIDPQDHRIVLMFFFYFIILVSDKT